MTGLSSTVISNLAYVVGALVLAIILGIAVWWRHRQPKSVDANVASFKRGLRALSPENRPAGVRVVTSGAGRGPNGSGETEPMRFTSIKLERIPEPISEPVSVESPGDEAAAVAGEIDEAAEPDAGGHDIAELASDELGGSRATGGGARRRVRTRLVRTKLVRTRPVRTGSSHRRAITVDAVAPGGAWARRQWTERRGRGG